MNKLKLDLGALRVESFEPAVAVSQTRGTVHARAQTDLKECAGLFGDTSVDCSWNPCTNDEQCLMATLPPKCI